MGATWVGLTSVPLGLRRVVDLARPAPAIAVGAADRVAALPEEVGDDLLQLPDHRLTAMAVPADCRSYLLRLLHGPAGRMGVLELAWRTPQLDVEFGALDAILRLAALLADDLAVRTRLDELQAQVEREVPYLRGELRGSGDLRTLTGDGPAMRAVRLAVQQVARTDSNVLIGGETGCVVVCPCECFYQDGSMLYIDPVECIDCEACVPECPVEAIFHDNAVPERWSHCTALNAERSAALKAAGGSITEKQEPMRASGCGG